MSPGPHSSSGLTRPVRPQHVDLLGEVRAATPPAGRPALHQPVVEQDTDCPGTFSSRRDEDVPWAVWFTRGLELGGDESGDERAEGLGGAGGAGRRSPNAAPSGAVSSCRGPRARRRRSPRARHRCARGRPAPSSCVGDPHEPLGLAPRLPPRAPSPTRASSRWASCSTLNQSRWSTPAARRPEAADAAQRRRAERDVAAVKGRSRRRRRTSRVSHGAPAARSAPPATPTSSSASNASRERLGPSRRHDDVVLDEREHLRASSAPARDCAPPRARRPRSRPRRRAAVERVEAPRQRRRARPRDDRDRDHAAQRLPQPRLDLLGGRGPRARGDQLGARRASASARSARSSSSRSTAAHSASRVGSASAIGPSSPKVGEHRVGAHVDDRQPAGQHLGRHERRVGQRQHQPDGRARVGVRPARPARARRGGGAGTACTISRDSPNSAISTSGPAAVQLVHRQQRQRHRAPRRHRPRVDEHEVVARGASAAAGSASWSTPRSNERRVAP